MKNCIKKALLQIDSFCFLQIKPKGPAEFQVFVRYGQRPTVTEYDTKMKLPDESCSLTSQNSNDDCSERAYEILLVQEVLSRPGTYFIGILYEKSGERIKRRKKRKARRRKKRSCFSRGREKRSCVELKDPPKPENITVKPVYDPKTDMNYTMSILEEECLFWDSTEEYWSSRGCKVSKLYIKVT